MRATDEAIAKIKREREQKGKLSNRAQAVFGPVCEALISFCGQSDTFAKAVAEGKTVSECCEETVKGNDQYLSDFTVYQRAVGFYMPGADIEWSMTVRPPETEKKTEAPTFNISFLTLLGGGKDAGSG